MSKYKKLGYTVRKKNALWLPSLVPRRGWVQIDIGFIGQSKKRYGEFILAVDTLSRRVKVQTFQVQAKTLKNLQTFIHFVQT